MAEAIAKIKDAKGVVNCNTGDTDGLLVNTLLEALTGTNRLNVGAYGRSTRTGTNYTAAGQSIDEHLAGIDTALGTKASSSHKDSHKSGGGDAFTSSDLLEAVGKRLRTTTGPADLLVGAITDGEYLKRSGTAIISGAPTAGAHLMGGSSHTADSLANLNSKVTFGNLDLDTSPRPAIQHSLGSSIRHSADSLANLNALVTGGSLDFSTASRPPNGSVPAGDLTGNYPSPTVAKIRGYTVLNHAPVQGEGLVRAASDWRPYPVWASPDKTASYSGSSSGGITGIAGKMFMVVLHGRWSGGGSGGDGYFYIRPNNISSSSYMWTANSFGNDTSNWFNNTDSYGLGLPNTYFIIARTPSGWDLEDVQAVIYIRAESAYSNYMMIQSDFVSVRGNTSNQLMYNHDNRGTCRSTAAVTSLYWGMTRGTFYGRITVFEYR